MAKIIAYHGYSITELPNSYSAYLAACNHAFWGVFASIRFTKDHVAITSDKPYLEIDKHRYYIDKTTYEELTNLGAFQLPNDISCSLKIFLELCKKYQKVACLEINRSTNTKEIATILEMLADVGMINQCKLISAKKNYLVNIRKDDLHIDLELLATKYHDSLLFDGCKYHFGIYLPINKVNADMVAFFHENQLKLAVGVTNNPIKSALYLEMGVDYIYSSTI